MTYEKKQLLVRNQGANTSVKIQARVQVASHSGQKSPELSPNE